MGGVQNLQFLGFPHGSARFNRNTGAKIKKHGGARTAQVGLPERGAAYLHSPSIQIEQLLSPVAQNLGA